jgi:hypothetical protein
MFKYYGLFTGEIGAFLGSLGLVMPLPLLMLALPIRPAVITFQATPSGSRWGYNDQSVRVGPPSDALRMRQD